MSDFKYSVVIRTLGNTGEKYNALLSSIKTQTCQPDEVIVAIPEGYDLDYSLGMEKIVRCEKGMVSQRAAGIDAAETEYILVVDDDVKFSPDFVSGLYRFMTAYNLDCVLPLGGGSGMEDKIDFSWPMFTRVRGAITGQFFTSRKKSSYLDRITRSAGHRVYVRCDEPDKCYLSQTGNFQCFFMKTQAAQSVHYMDEKWLQQGTYSYASYDDATFFYKLFLQGGIIGYSLRSRFEHLDAGAGRPAKSRLDEKKIRYYTVARNRTIFWYKFIYCGSNMLYDRVLAIGGVFMDCLIMLSLRF